MCYKEDLFLHYLLIYVIIETVYGGVKTVFSQYKVV